MAQSTVKGYFYCPRGQNGRSLEQAAFEEEALKLPDIPRIRIRHFYPLKSCGARAIFLHIRNIVTRDKITVLSTNFRNKAAINYVFDNLLAIRSAR
jgi:hypothetical protein